MGQASVLSLEPGEDPTEAKSEGVCLRPPALTKLGTCHGSGEGARAHTGTRGKSEL
jgi:hypothetical protein